MYIYMCVWEQEEGKCEICAYMHSHTYIHMISRLLRETWTPNLPSRIACRLLSSIVVVSSPKFNLLSIVLSRWVRSRQNDWHDSSREGSNEAIQHDHLSTEQRPRHVPDPDHALQHRLLEVHHHSDDSYLVRLIIERLTGMASTELELYSTCESQSSL